VTKGSEKLATKLNKQTETTDLKVFGNGKVVTQLRRDLVKDMLHRVRTGDRSLNQILEHILPVEEDREAIKIALDGPERNAGVVLRNLKKVWSIWHEYNWRCRAKVLTHQNVVL
jgi:hypothetical protein